MVSKAAEVLSKGIHTQHVGLMGVGLKGRRGSVSQKGSVSVCPLQVGCLHHTWEMPRRAVALWVRLLMTSSWNWQDEGVGVVDVSTCGGTVFPYSGHTTHTDGCTYDLTY